MKQLTLISLLILAIAGLFNQAGSADRVKDPLLVFIKGGCFKMGESSEIARKYEKPVHPVCVDDFHLSKYEVTVGAFKSFVKDTGYKTDAEKGDGCLIWMGTGWRRAKEVIWNRPGFIQTESHPVTCVSWNDAFAYVMWKRKKTGLQYRLPTEAEWEYAAQRGVREMPLTQFNGESLEAIAWYHHNSEGKTHPVGQKQPNRLGLYDMQGNVWEWLQDWYDDDYYRHSVKDNPLGPSSGKGNVVRGGSWYVALNGLRITHRNWSPPYKRYNSYGFRLAL